MRRHRATNVSRNDELPNTGCNYDPADPRGEDEDEPERDRQRRSWLWMAKEARRYAEDFTGTGTLIRLFLIVYHPLGGWCRLCPSYTKPSGLCHILLVG
jgi:hypothetical protein